MAARFIDVWVNCPDRETAERIASGCLGDRLTACANILAPIESTYRWQGVVKRAREVPLLMKTRAELFDSLAAKVRSAHPYDVPSIVATELSHIDKGYAEWLARETKEPV
jgi:periplasmic divalent cation tolerance protein